MVGLVFLTFAVLVYDNNVIRIKNFDDVTLQSFCGSNIYFALLLMPFLCLMYDRDLFPRSNHFNVTFFFTAAR